MILTIRTDSPIAEIGLYNTTTQISYHKWQADRRLAKEILTVIHEQLLAQKADWPAVTGVVVFEGPGSFTGLRIGITVADSIAYGNGVPIVGVRDEDWIATGLRRVAAGENDRLALPHYGAEAHITMPKK
jgi:tRNA threonylcarbamoyladenosine biosynthesis protein TsaB